MTRRIWPPLLLGSADLSGSLLLLLLFCPGRDKWKGKWKFYEDPFRLMVLLIFTNLYVSQ
jgi:hypothetical protein